MAIFGIVKKLKVYISYFLLLVFAWVITPTHTIHNLFADHEDTADNYCLVNHAHLGTHVETQHTHCDILDINTPVYCVPRLIVISQLTSIINTKHLITHLNRIISFSVCNLPSRAPPILA